MNLKDIPRITELGNKLTAIKQEINKIAKIATLISNGDAVASFELKVVDNTKTQTQSEPQPQDDELTDILGQAFPGLKIIPLSIGSGIGGGISGFMTPKSKNIPKDNILSLNLMDSDVLLILGNLVAKRHLQQTEILTELKKLGVKEEKSL